MSVYRKVRQLIQAFCSLDKFVHVLSCLGRSVGLLVNFWVCFYMCICALTFVCVRIHVYMCAYMCIIREHVPLVYVNVEVVYFWLLQRWGLRWHQLLQPAELWKQKLCCGTKLAWIYYRHHIFDAILDQTVVKKYQFKSAFLLEK